MREEAVEFIEEIPIIFEELLVEYGIGMFIVGQLLSGAGILFIIPDEAVTPTFTMMFADNVLEAALVGTVAATALVIGNFLLYAVFRLLGERLISYQRRSTRYWRFMEWAIKENAKISLIVLRLVPFVGGMAAVPAGLVKVRVKTFMIYSFIGFLIYELVLSVGIWYSIEQELFTDIIAEYIDIQ